MTIIELARTQWADYGTYHQSRLNRAIHLVAVPLFWAGLALLAVALATAQARTLAVGLALLPVSLGLQAFGHGLEPVPAVPFTSAANAVARLLLEQLVSFPRYLLSLRVFGRTQEAGLNRA